MTVAERISDLSVLWKEASVVFPFFDRRELNWDAAYRDYLDRVIRTEDACEFHLLLAEFLNLLGDGHTDYTPPKSMVDEVGMLPFSLKYVDGGYCVRAIRQGGEAYLAAKVLAINSRGMRQVAGDLARYSYHADNFISRPNLFLPFLLNPTGNVLETTAGSYAFDLQKTMPDLVAVGELLTTVPYREIPSDRLCLRRYDGDILYIKMNDFLYRAAAEEIEGALRACGALKGVVLDLRENTGGMTKFAAAVAELFISGEFHSLQKHTRSMTGKDLASAGQLLMMPEEERVKWCDEAELERCHRISSGTYFEEWEDTVGSPEHWAMYEGPVTLLTSRYTVSAAEDFVAMFRSTGRGTVVGEATQGTTGTPLLLPLSGGGRARICSIGNRLIDGTEFIGVGIVPDLQMALTAEEYAAGKDSVLEDVLNGFQ